MNAVAELMNTMWTLDEGLRIVRILQPHTRQFGYHLAIGGGVVNTGRSTKDLDLYFLPLDSDRHPNPDPNKLLAWLEDLWGPSAPLIGDRYIETRRYALKRKFHVAGRRVDVFIV